MVWVREQDWQRDVFIMEWGACLDAGFRKGKGMTLETAKVVSGKTVEIISVKSRKLEF